MKRALVILMRVTSQSSEENLARVEVRESGRRFRVSVHRLIFPGVLLKGYKKREIGINWGRHCTTRIGPQLFNDYSPTNYNKRFSYRPWGTR